MKTIVLSLVLAIPAITGCATTDSPRVASAERSKKPLIADGSYQLNQEEPSLQPEAKVREFYRRVEEGISGNPDQRYEAYWNLIKQYDNTPSDTLINDAYNRALVTKVSVLEAIQYDLQKCSANLARAAAQMVVYLGLKQALEIRRFRDTTIPEEVRLSLLRTWLNAVAKIYDDKTKRAEVWRSVLTDMENDPSPLIRQAIPLYREMLGKQTCCFGIHYPNDRLGPINAQGFIDFSLDPDSKFYETDDVFPLPKPSTGPEVTCPHT